MYCSYNICDWRTIKYGYNREQYFKKKLNDFLTDQQRCSWWSISKDYSLEEIKTEAKIQTVRAFLK